ncbi:MAG: S8 family serine peptidase, partial [Planctomycetota bacterium]
GGDGGRGADCGPFGSDGGWAGKAYGGAVYIDPNSIPKFVKCTFKDCFARGGDGGDGGNGVFQGGRGGNWEWAPSIETGPFTFPLWFWWDGWFWETFFGPFDDYWKYSGYGGAVHCASKGSPTFTDCTFTDNHSYGGVCGVGGTPFQTPDRNLNIENFGGTIYITNGSPLFTDCNISISSADTFTVDIPDDVFVSYGGAIAIEDAQWPIFTDCNIDDANACIGGGVYWSNATPTFNHCEITNSKAYHGAGFYSAYATGTIREATVVQNVASVAVAQPNDPNLPFSTIFGRGGGYCSVSSPVEVIDSVFSENRATGSGGGVYFIGSDQNIFSVPLLDNCLIINNTGGRDGGGVSCNMHAEPIIASCTIADNRLDKIPSYGGGLFCSYLTIVDVIDSIVWANRATDGAQIAVGSGHEFAFLPSILNFSYSDVGPPYDPNALPQVGQGGPVGSGAPEGEGSARAEAGGLAVLVDHQTIYDQFDAGQDTVEVIVSLAEPVEARAVTDWRSPASVSLLRTEIADRQSPVLSSLTPAEFGLRYRYENLTAFSGSVTLEGLNKLLADPSVTYVEPVRYADWMLAQSIPLANAVEVRQLYDGNGVAVAIADSGIDYNHPMLGGGGFPNTKVIGGYDTADGDGNPGPGADGEPHGTACAGIAAGDLGEVGDYIGGVAHGAKLYALKISFDSGGISGAGSLAAWDWCVTHQYDDPANPIMVISNSWGMYGLPFDNPDD